VRALDERTLYFLQLVASCAFGNTKQALASTIRTARNSPSSERRLGLAQTVLLDMLHFGRFAQLDPQLLTEFRGLLQGMPALWKPEYEDRLSPPMLAAVHEACVRASREKRAFSLEEADAVAANAKTRVSSPPRKRRRT